MKSRTTWLLLIGVLILGAYVISTDQNEARLDRRLRAARQAFNLDSRDVTSLRISMPDAQFILTKKEGTWRLDNPVQAEADANAVLGLLESISALRWTTMVTKEEQKELGLTLKDYGLEQPRVSIEVSGDQMTFSLLVGRDAPGGTEVYVKRENISSVFSVSREFLAKLPASSLDIRDRRILNVSPEKIRRIGWTSREGTFQAIKSGDDRWQLVKPAGTHANGPALRQWLNRVYELSAADFVAETISVGALYGFDEPVLTVTFDGENAMETRTIKIGNALDANANLFYATITGQDKVFSITQDALQLLTVREDQFRDYRLLPFEAVDITSIKMSDEDRALEIALSTQGVWEVITPKQFSANQERARDVLDAWSSASVLKFIDQPDQALSMYGLDTTTRVIRFKRALAPGATGEREAVLQIGRPTQAGSLFVLMPARSSIMQVPATLLSRFSADPLQFRDPVVLAISTTNIVRIAQKIGQLEISVELIDGFFRPSQPNFAPDTDAIRLLLGQLSELRTSAFVAEDPPDLSIYGLNPPFAEVILGLPVSGLNRVLAIGREDKSGQRYAMIRGTDAVFTINRSIISVLLKPVANPLTPDAAAYPYPEVW